ncbi:hypothetical protein ACWTU6_14070 [Mesorhizobium sp. BHbsci]
MVGVRCRHGRPLIGLVIARSVSVVGAVIRRIVVHVAIRAVVSVSAVLVITTVRWVFIVILIA